MKIQFTLAIYHVIFLAAFAKVDKNDPRLLRGSRNGGTPPRRKLGATFIKSFVGVGTGGCKGRNELGTFSKYDRSSCAMVCRHNPECVSFEWKEWEVREGKSCAGYNCQSSIVKKQRCALSSSCVGPDQTFYFNTDDDYLYVKTDRIPNAAHVDGYVAVKTGGCPGKNELGTTEESTAQDCADKCSQKTDCVSFEFGKINRRCALSSSCDSLSLTVKKNKDSNYWYAKEYESGKGVQHNAVQESWNGSDLFYSYDAHDTGGCKGSNELGKYSGKSVKECAELCESKSDCVSFAYPKFETGKCQLSSSCDNVSESVDDAGDKNFLFIKK